MTATATPAEDSGRLGAPRPVGAPRRTRLLRASAPALTAAAAGLLLYTSFPPRQLWWLAPVAFAVFAATLTGKRARAGFGLGCLFGLGFLLPLLVWTGVEVGPVPWLALAAIESVFSGLAGAAATRVLLLPGGPLWAAALWTAFEAARARLPFGGFPWGKVAFGQADGVFLPLAAVGGTPVLGFAVVLTGFGLFFLARAVTASIRGDERTPAPAALWRSGAVLASCAAVLLPLVAALAARPLVSDSAQNGTATIAVVQGNVPRAGLDFNAQRRAVLDHHVAETRRLAAEVARGEKPRPDFVLWPENSSDIDPFTEPDARAAVESAVRAVGVPVAVGAVVERDGKLYNEQVLWTPEQGPTDTYDKRAVQPFGEYIPLRSFVSFFSSDVDLVRQDFSRGSRPGVFTMAGARVGLVTCYEAAFDWAVRDTVRNGASMISVPSNNATFGHSEMTYQQLAMSRIRAVEHSRAVAVPVTSGVSAVIMPDGKVVQRTGMFTADNLVEEVPLRSTQTPATRLGPLPEWVLAALGVGALALTFRRRIAEGGQPDRSAERD